MARLAAILGSVTPPGRLSSAVAGALDRAAASGTTTTLVDLGSLTIGFADGTPLEKLTDDTSSLVEAVSAADAVLLATPVYRASMTGAVKNVLDFLPMEALRGKPVGLIVMWATLHHFLGPESHLRDVLAWFGAVTLPTSIYLSSADFVDGVISEKAAGALDHLVATSLQLADALNGAIIGPPPLSARRG